MATNVMFGSTVRTVKDASGNVTGLSAGGPPGIQITIPNQLHRAIDALSQRARIG